MGSVKGDAAPPTGSTRGNLTGSARGNLTGNAKGDAPTGSVRGLTGNAKGDAGTGSARGNLTGSVRGKLTDGPTKAPAGAGPPPPSADTLAEIEELKKRFAKDPAAPSSQEIPVATDSAAPGKKKKKKKKKKMSALETAPATGSSVVEEITSSSQVALPESKETGSSATEDATAKTDEKGEKGEKGEKVEDGKDAPRKTLEPSVSEPPSEPNPGSLGAEAAELSPPPQCRFRIPTGTRLPTLGGYPGQVVTERCRFGVIGRF